MENERDEVMSQSEIKAITEEEQSGKVPSSFTTYQAIDKNDLIMCLFDLDQLFLG